MRHTCTTLLPALLCVILPPLSFGADDTAALKQRLHTAAKESALDTPDLKPWHLLLSFQLLDSKGQPGESGTIEEWWAAPHLHKTVYTSPSYNNTEVVNEKGLYKLSPDAYPPETLALVLDQIVHPMSDETEIEDSKPDLRKQVFGKVPLDCIMLDQKIANLAFPPLGLFPTFCFDRDKTTLRLSFSNGSILMGSNLMGIFQGKSVAIDQDVIIDKVPVIKAHVEKLSGSKLLPTDFLPTPEMVSIDERAVQVPGGVIAASAVKKVPPIYPERAKANHSSGTVILHALIGTDGRIHHLTLVSSPDPDLALASFAAVRSWTYKPYLLNGKPTMVDTTISVNFRIGPA